MAANQNVSEEDPGKDPEEDLEEVDATVVNDDEGFDISEAWSF